MPSDQNVAVASGQADEEVGTSRVHELERRVRTRAPCWGRKTMEVEILSARCCPGKKTDIATTVMERSAGRFAMKTVADTLPVALSNLIERVNRPAKPRGHHRKCGDEPLLALIRRLMYEAPIGYRRITRLVNRRQKGQRQANG